MKWSVKTADSFLSFFGSPETHIVAHSLENLWTGPVGILDSLKLKDKSLIRSVKPHKQSCFPHWSLPSKI
jgi:hypothetical protein